VFVIDAWCKHEEVWLKKFTGVFTCFVMSNP